MMPGDKHVREHHMERNAQLFRDMNVSKAGRIRDDRIGHKGPGIWIAGERELFVDLIIILRKNWLNAHAIAGLYA